LTQARAEKATREAEWRYPVEQGTGANACAYFACNALGDAALARLPDVRRRDVRREIATALMLKRLRTGSPAACVSTFPPVPWDEAVFLHVQIARIGADGARDGARVRRVAHCGEGRRGQDDTCSRGGDGAARPARSEEIEPLGPAGPDGEPEEWLASWCTGARTCCRVPSAANTESGRLRVLRACHRDHRRCVVGCQLGARPPQQLAASKPQNGDACGPDGTDLLSIIPASAPSEVHVMDRPRSEAL
jgi:Radial spokehead-like protein